MKPKIQPVILSGGSGTRLWPLSRELYPKQLLPLVGENTLLQETVLRLQGLQENSGFEVAAPIVICNEEHRFLVAEQLRQIECTPAQIILEPFGRNTAPAIALADQWMISAGQDNIMLVLPADHSIGNLDAFLGAVEIGASLSDQEHLVTFGIVPNHPETGFGYIKTGKTIAENAYTIQSFVEKPDLTTAQQYLKSKEYLWNSGMFMFKAYTFHRALETFEQEIAACCKEAILSGSADRDFFRIDKTNFEKCPSNSIDYAVMEKVADKSCSQDFKTAVVSLDARWSDVGSWSALWEVNEKDQHGNVIKGDVFIQDSKNSIVFSESRFVSVLGMQDIVAVETADSVLIMKKNKAQDVKQIVNWLKKNNRYEHFVHKKVFRPWGGYEGVNTGDRYQVKRITVNPGASLSLQMHHHRAEHWVVVKGTAKVTCGENVFLVSENQSTFIPIGEKHRLENPGYIPLEIIEVQSGSYLNEDDIIRFEDSYGR